MQRYNENLNCQNKERKKVTERSSKDILKYKMYSKYVSKGIAMSMMYYNPSSTLFKAYKNTSYCCETLISNNGILSGTYCKNRWCQVCNRIKTARLINGYMPSISTFGVPVFVTLTAPTVKGEEGLIRRIKEFEKAWREIYDLTRKVKYKREYQVFKGIRKAEVTIRPDNKYHYHFHVLMEGWAQGMWLIGQWLKRFPDANLKAQNLRFVDEFGKFEVFKYAIKSEVKKDSQSAERYDVVFRALRNKQTYSAFGGIKKIKEDFEDDELKGVHIGDVGQAIYKWVGRDWFNKETGEALVNIPIPKKVENMVSYPPDE